jgi:hypothetical protein
MNIEVISGVKERRSRLTLDSYTGVEWHRLGTGQYEVWSNIPPRSQWCSLDSPPPIGHTCLFWLSSGPHRGLRIGKATIQQLDMRRYEVNVQHPDMRRYEIQKADHSWMTVVSKVIGGWLLLPPDDAV